MRKRFNCSRRTRPDLAFSIRVVDSGMGAPPATIGISAGAPGLPQVRPSCPRVMVSNLLKNDQRGCGYGVAGRAVGRRRPGL